MNTGVSLRIAGTDWCKLKELVFTSDGNENSAVLLCGRSADGLRTTLLARRVVGVPLDQYLERQSFHIAIAPRFYNQVIELCLREDLTPVICHSHPSGESANYSTSDDLGERRLLPILESLLPGRTPASLLLTPNSLAGRLLCNSDFRSLDEVTITGPRVQLFPVGSARQQAVSDCARFDRQIRAFTEVGQSTIESLTVAIVGLGGIGSIVAEQLARVGVRKIILVDFDQVDRSNLNRLIGADADSIGRPKVAVAEANLKSKRSIDIEAICDSVVKQSVLKRLRGVDLILGCVDSDLARTVLARFAYQYLIPLIDMGTRLDARSGDVAAAAGRVSIVGVDAACLRCGHHIDAERVRAESLPPSERDALAREGYIMGLDDPAPAVVTLNCVVAGLGATAAVNLFVNLTGNVQPSNQLYDAFTGTMFTATAVHERGCDICDPHEGVKAMGDGQVVSAYE